MKNDNVRALVVGSINMDLVISLDRNPEAGETVMGDTYSYIPGGKGANQAVAAARIGADVTFCGRVGNDANGSILIDNLNKNSIDTSFIKRDDTSPTGLAVIPVDKNGQNRIIVLPGANSCVLKEDVNDAFKDNQYDIVLLQLEVPLEIVYYTYNIAALKGIPVILDCGPAMEIDLSRFTGIKVISPNETEAYALTGVKIHNDETAVRAAQILYNSSKAEYVVIKLGGKGALLYDGKNHELIPAYKNINVVDTTAAGDSFTAALAVKLIETGDIKESIKYANGVGAICVSRKGAQPSLPYAHEVNEFLKSINN